MKHCYGYIRVSTVKQGDGVSLEAQKEAIRAFASHNAIKIVEWYEEKETAAKTGRPVFNRMIANLRKRKAQGLVVHKIDRFARNLTDYGRISQLMDLGLEVFTAIESLDFQSRGGRLAADVQAVVAADFIRNQRQETIKGLYGRLAQGIYPFKAPLGYLDHGAGKHKTFDPERAPLIREAFELYASGDYSQLALLAVLRKRGLTGGRGAPISSSTLEALLANPFYAGIIKIKRNGRTFQGGHQPLISMATFERAQAVKAGKALKKCTMHEYTYRRLFRCRHCDGAMTPERQKGVVYYRCHTNGCATKSIRESVLEDQIYQCLKQVTLTDREIDRLMVLLRGWMRARQKQLNQEAIPLKLNQLAEKRERLTDALIDRLVSQEIFEKRNEALLFQEQRLREREAQISSQRPDPKQARKFFELVKSLASTYISASPAHRRELAAIATSNRWVEGKKPYVEPSDWLQRLGHVEHVLNGGHYEGTFRTSGANLNDIFELFCSERFSDLKRLSLAVSQNKV